MAEQELFQGYEVKNWDFSPRFYKILAASAIFNILAILGVAQTNLLTTKGCDSPLVSGVCQVLDTIVVGGTVLSTNKEYINDPNYIETDLQDADITWINETGVERFQYPEGYRALANPDLMTPTEIPNADGSFPANIPGIPNPTTNGGGTTDLMNKPQVLPPSNDNPISGGKLPDSPFSFGGGNPTTNSRVKIQRPKFPTIKTQKNPTLPNNSPDKLPDLTKDNTAKTDEKKNPTPTPEPKSDSLTAVEINKEPMKKFASDVKVKFEKKEVDLNQNFKIVAEGVLTKDGKLDVTIDKKTKQPKSKILLKEGDSRMTEIAEKAIAAIGDSGWLGYLRNQGVDKINFTVVQDNDNLQVIITSDLLTTERASTVSNGLGGAISGALILDENGFKKLGDDEKLLLKNAKAMVNPANKNQFVLNFVIPKATAQEMINRKLKEADPNYVPAKPNGTAQIKDKNTNTAK